jgi:phage terminase large subunit
MMTLAPNEQLTLEEQIAAAEEIRAIYEPQPHLLVRDIFGATTWSAQDDIVQSVFRNKITCVKTCNAVGKSYIAARVALAYLTIYPGSIVVTTAPTWRQVKDVLWREFAVAVKRSKMPLTKKEVKQAGLDIAEDWYAVGLSTKYPENFFGYHADRILVIVDEAGGVEEPIFKGVNAITPNINARVLLIGNPTNPSGTFFDYFNKPELGATCFTISAFQSPNFTATGITSVEKLLKVFTVPAGSGYDQAEWIRMVNIELQKRMDQKFAPLIDPSVVFSRYHEWGPDSPAWQALVLGEFPSQAEQSLIPMNIAQMAFGMGGKDQETGKTFAELSGWNIPDGPERYGVDMARFGGDRTVVTPRHGGWVRKQIAWNRIDLMTSADRIVDIIDTDDPLGRVNIDDTGNGGGTTDRIMQKSKERVAQDEPAYEFRLAAYNMSSKERMAEPLRYYDVTSEQYWNLRNWFVKKKIAFEDYDQELYDELVGRRWGIVNGKIKVESKDEYRKRTNGKSPDKSDSLALSFAGEKPDGTTHDVTTKQDEYYKDKIQELEGVSANDVPITGGLQERY